MDFIKKIFGTGSNIPPKRVSENLMKHFANAISVEWIKHDEIYEAVFFEDEIEKTAQFNKDGKLIEYTINLVPDDIPPIIRSGMDDEMEIMNCIAIYNSGAHRYELIVRDKELTRYFMWVDSLGEIIKQETL
jgi:hypothetical protein